MPQPPGPQVWDAAFDADGAEGASPRRRDRLTPAQIEYLAHLKSARLA